MEPAFQTENITTILAWRHGETHANKEHSLSGAAATGPKFNLTETGRQQAVELSKKIFTEYPDLEFVYSSDLQRAIDTAKIVTAQHKKIAFITNPQLREIYHGEFEGGPDVLRNQKAEEQCSVAPETPIKDKYQFWRVHPLTQKSVNDDVPVRDIAIAIEENDPDPETVVELYRRASAAFISLAKQHLGKTIAISSHGGLLGTLAEELRYKDKVVVLPPYYVKAKHIASNGEVLMPAVARVGNCQLLRFRYHHLTESLELLT